LVCYCLHGDNDRKDFALDMGRTLVRGGYFHNLNFCIMFHKIKDPETQGNARFIFWVLFIGLIVLLLL
jgi:hypothetical protein